MKCICIRAGATGTVDPNLPRPLFQKLRIHFVYFSNTGPLYQIVQVQPDHFIVHRCEISINSCQDVDTHKDC